MTACRLPGNGEIATVNLSDKAPFEALLLSHSFTHFLRYT